MIAMLYTLIQENWAVWSQKYEENRLYTLVDFLMTNDRNINITDIVLAFITSFILTFIFLWQALFIIFFILIQLYHFKFKGFFFKIERQYNIIHNLFIIIPNAYSVLIIKKVLKGYINKQDFKIIVLNFYFVMCYTRSRRNVNNTKIICSYKNNILKHPLWPKKPLMCIKDTISFIIEEEFLHIHNIVWEQ